MNGVQIEEETGLTEFVILALWDKGFHYHDGMFYQHDRVEYGIETGRGAEVVGESSDLAYTRSFLPLWPGGKLMRRVRSSRWEPVL